MIKMMGNHLIIPGGTRSIDATGKLVDIHEYFHFVFEMQENSSCQEGST